MAKVVPERTLGSSVVFSQVPPLTSYQTLLQTIAALEKRNQTAKNPKPSLCVRLFVQSLPHAWDLSYIVMRKLVRSRKVKGRGSRGLAAGENGIKLRGSTLWSQGKVGEEPAGCLSATCVAKRKRDSCQHSWDKKNKHLGVRNEQRATQYALPQTHYPHSWSR